MILQVNMLTYQVNIILNPMFVLLGNVEHAHEQLAGTFSPTVYTHPRSRPRDKTSTNITWLGNRRNSTFLLVDLFSLTSCRK